MALDPQTIKIAQSMVPTLEARGPEITQRFYYLLLTEHPGLMNIFNHSNQRDGLQQQALATAVYAAVAHIDKLHAILPTVKHIAHKHRSLGVAPEHYPVVGAYLTRALKDILGDAITPHMEQAWQEAYAYIAQAFIQLEKDMSSQAAHNEGGWRGFRSFRVVQRVAEAEGIISLYLSPVDGKPIASYQAGQYVSVKIHDQGHDHLRQYSLSHLPGQDFYRISPKLEEGRNKADAGIVSTYLHTQIQEGSTLELSAPAGVFTLDTTSQKPLVFLAAGIGITPLLSMLYDLHTKEDHPAALLAYALRNGTYHAFGQEIQRLTSSNLKAVTFYEDPTAEDRQKAAFNRAGRIHPDWLQENVPADAQVYICGPRPFMQIMIQHLLRQGLPLEQIQYEVFGPALSFTV